MKVRLMISLSLGCSLVFATPALAHAPMFHVKHRNEVRFNMAVSHPKTYALTLLARKGFSKSQYAGLSTLWARESNWNRKAKNHHSTAYGIGQLLNEKSHNPAVQIQNGIGYIISRYSTPCLALRHSYAFGWY